MSQGTRTTMGPPGPGTKLRRTLFSALLLLASCLTAVALSVLAPQHELDHHLLDHRPRRRRPDAEPLGHRPVHPHVRHRASDPVRLLPLGVPGARHRVTSREPGSAAFARLGPRSAKSSRPVKEGFHRERRRTARDHPRA